MILQGLQREALPLEALLLMSAFAHEQEDGICVFLARSLCSYKFFLSTGIADIMPSSMG